MQKTTGAVNRTAADYWLDVVEAEDRLGLAVRAVKLAYREYLAAKRRDAAFGQGAAGDSQDARPGARHSEADA